MNKVLIIEDEEKIVEIIEAYLLKEGLKVFKAYTGEEGLNIYRDNDIDIVLLDLMLPGIMGEDLAVKMKNLKDIPIVMLTAKALEKDILNGFSLGVDDYITKPFRPKEVVARVKAVLNRTKKDKSIEYGDLKIVKETHGVYKNGEEVTLTPSEFKILITLIENKNKIFTRSELLDICLNDEGNVFDRIIDTHVKNIRNKIGDNGEKQKFIKTIHGVGYRFVGGDNENIK
ncbi:MAG: response regulator transcription factor [Clostridium sp.]